MDMETVAIKLTDHENEISSLKHRMKAVEDANTTLTRLATAVEVMATKLENTGQSVDKLTAKVEALEAEPGKKWRFVVEKAIYFVVAAVVGFVLANVGL
jgi:peptidoglycan hydrolase CwlO-like protein